MRAASVVALAAACHAAFAAALPSPAWADDVKATQSLIQRGSDLFDDQQYEVTFKGPGYAADALVDRKTGRYELTQSFHGLVAIANDLHKGRDTGPAWSLLIDVSAVVVTLISVTGLVLLFYLKMRRVPGVVVAVIGTIAVIGVFLLGVP